jgi:hypothetical protein
MIVTCLSLWRLRYVEPLKYDFFVKNQPISELLQLKSLLFSDFYFRWWGLWKVQIGAQLNRESTVLLDLLGLFKSLIVESKTVKEGDLSSSIQKGILRALKQMSWLLNRVLCVIKDDAVQDLSLIHGHYQYWVAAVPRRLPFLGLPASAPENVEEIETAIGFRVTLVFLGSFLFWKRYPISIFLGCRHLSDTPFVMFKIMTIASNRTIPTHYRCSISLPNDWPILDNWSLRRDLAVCSLMCNHMRQVFGHRLVWLAQCDHNYGWGHWLGLFLFRLIFILWGLNCW